MIDYQYTGMRLVLVHLRPFLQRLAVRLVVLLLKGRRLSVDTPRDDRLWNVGNKIARLWGMPGW